MIKLMGGLLVGVVVGCLTLQPVIAQDAPRRGGTLQVGLAEDPPELDPHLSASNAARSVMHNIFATLVEIDEKLRIVPGIASSWNVSQDGLTYTFHLRDDVIFHDGTALDAKAVKYNFDRILDPKFGSPRASEIAYVKEVKVDDNYTVTLQLSQPFAALLPALASWTGMIVSPAAVEKHGRDFSQVLVGAGPFKFVEQIRNDRVALERFDGYFKKGLPYLDRVVYRPFVDVDSRILNLESGAIHMINAVPGAVVERISSNADLTLSTVGGLGFRGVWLNTQSAELGTPQRRAAFSACIDRQVIVKTVFGEAAVPATGPFSRETWVVDDTDQVPARNITLSRALLAEAGVPGGFEFTMLITPDAESIRIASIITAMCQEVGINIKIQQGEFGSIMSRMRANSMYTAALIEVSPRNEPDLIAYPFFHSTGGLNLSHYRSEEMDQLLDAGRASTDQAERKRIYRSVIDVLNRDFPYIFIYHLQEMKAFRKTVKGYRHIPDAMMRFEDVWLEK